MISGSAL